MFSRCFRTAPATAAARLFAGRQASTAAKWGKRSKTGPSYWNYSLVILPLVFSGLGFWQIQRMKWKEGIIKALHENDKKSAPTLPAKISAEDLAVYEFQKFKVKGWFLHRRELYLKNRRRGGKRGADIITPFVREDIDGSQQVILVNRGLVATEDLEKRIRDPESGNRYQDVVEIEGILRSSESVRRDTFRLLNCSLTIDSIPFKRSVLMGENHPDKLEFVWVDVPTMARIAGAAPVILYQTGDAVNGESQKGLVAHPVKLNLSNRHLEYVFTWFGAAAFSTLFLIFTRKQLFPPLRSPAKPSSANQ